MPSTTQPQNPIDKRPEQMYNPSRLDRVIARLRSRADLIERMGEKGQITIDFYGPKVDVKITAIFPDN